MHGSPTGARRIHDLRLHPTLRLLRGNRNFRRLWLAQIVSEIGDWFYTLSIYTLLLQLTGHAGSVALALVLQVLPQTFVGPTAGVVNDRLRRKHVMIAADLIRFVVVLAMLFVRSRSMVWLVYPLLLAETTMAAFFEPARSAVIPNIAAESEVLVANTLSSATWSVNLLIGASVGGVVAAFFGRDTVFILNALSFLTSAFLIGGMHFAEPHAEFAAPLRPRDLVDFSPVLEGIRYIRSHPHAVAGGVCQGRRTDGRAQLGDFYGDGRARICGARARHRCRGRSHARHEHSARRTRPGSAGRPAGFGALGGAERPSSAAGNSCSAIVTIACGYGVLGASRSVWMAAACAMLAHAGGSTVWVFSTTLLQFHTEDRFRGRVSPPI